MILTYKDKKFILTLNSAGTAPTSKSWLKNFANNTYQTKDINAAAQFKSVADEAALKLFRRVLIRKMPFPLGGVVSPPGETLFPFQRDVGIPFILSRSRSYLAHQPGLGKSAQFICAVNSKPGRALIVCPSFLKNTWAREITKWSARSFPTIAVVPDTVARFQMNWDADYIIVSDAMLIKFWVIENLYKVNFKFIAIDEAHRFKDPLAARAVALFGGVLTVKGEIKLKSPGLIYKADHVVALSGTPMLNRPMELWPVLYAMAPQTIDFMDQQTFGFRYCAPTQNEYGQYMFLGSDNEKELHQKVFGMFMQRLTKADVLKDLPPKIRQVIMLPDPDKFLAKQILQMDRALQDNLNLDDIEKLETLGDFAIVRHDIGICKVQYTIEFISNLLLDNPKEQIILFAHHRDVVERLSEGLFQFRPGIINGGISAQARQTTQDDFQAGNCKLIIGNIDAMNLGLTLTAATRIVFCEYAWTPAANEQAEDRAHRIGQTDSVFVQYLVAPGTLDEIILNALLEKQKRIDKVVEGKK